MKKIIQCGMLLSLILVLFNCQKEDDTIIQEAQQKNSNVTFTTIRSKTIENNKALKTILEKQKTKQIEAKTNKTIYNEQYDFTINTDYAKVIEHNSLKRYTFGVTRTEDNGLLENLLLKEQTDGTFKVYLVTYAITEAERNTLANQEIVDVDNKITYVLLEDISSSIFNKVSSNAETCTVYSYEWEDGNLCSANGNHSYQDGGYSESNPGGCHAWGNPDLMATSGGYVLTSNEVDCGNGSTSGYEPDNNTTNSDTTNGTTNSNGGGNYTPIPDTEVILCTDCPVIEDDCSSTDELNSLASTLSLDAALVACLSDEEKCGAVGELAEFIETNNTPYDIEFAQIAIEMICDDNQIKVANLIKIINGMDKNCQALVLFRSFKVNTPFINSIKTVFFYPENKGINLQDLAVGDGEPTMQENVGARTHPFYGTDSTTNSQNMIIQFNDTHLENATDIGYINTLYHELLHAYIYDLYHKEQLLSDYPQYSELKISLDNYFSDVNNENLLVIKEEEMHNIYVDFIDLLAESLLEYCTINNVDGIDIEYAKKLV